MVEHFFTADFKSAGTPSGVAIVDVPLTQRNPMKKNDEATPKKGASWTFDTPPQKHKSQSSAFGRLAFITPIYIFR